MKSLYQERLKNAIEEDKLTGIHFASVQHYRIQNENFQSIIKCLLILLCREMDENTNVSL